MAMRDYAAAKELFCTTLGRGVQGEYAELQDIVGETKEILTGLERRHLQGDEDPVARMLCKELYYQADDVLDEFSFEAMRMQMKFQKCKTRKVSKSYSLSNPLLFRRRMSRKIKDFRHVLDELKEGIEFPYSTVVENHGINNEIGPLPTAGNIDDFLEVYGRDEERKRIIKMLIDSNNEEMLSVIPIVGMMGVGKTTLAQLIFNDESIRSHFDLRFWVSVSQEFKVEEILKQIIRVSTRSMPYVTTLDSLRHMLEEVLSGKRFLLVLDDVWNEDREIWDNFKASLRAGYKGSRILVTARYHRVASITGTLAPYVLQLLSEQYSWELFRSLAFGRGDAEDENGDLVEIGMQIAKLCHGIPLALMIVGSFLRDKRDEHQWIIALKTLDRPDDESDGGIRVFISRVLILSYIDMVSPLKRCFAYCSVFPKDCRIGKKELIQLWMAEGLLDEASSNNGNDVMEDIGNAYFNSLVLRSFLQVVGRDDEGEPLACRMNDLVRGFALNTVLGNEVMRVEGVYEVEKIRETRYLSLSVPDTKSIPDKFYTMKNVRTCLGCPSNISTGLLSNFKTLRVLELRHASKELPSSIGELIHLRYLDLSHGRFKALPASIFKLYHLQTLKLLYCRYLQRLPKGMKKLINLRHLEIEKRLNIPRGLGQLCNLRALTSFKVCNNDTEADIEELGCLQQLGGSLSLFGLGNLKNKEKAKAANLKVKEKLRELTLEWESDWHDDWHDYTDEDRRKQDDLLEELQPHENLLILRILCFSGTKLPTWLSGSLPLSNIQELSFYSCHNVKSADMTGLRSLRKLMISYCENLECAGVEGLGPLELLEFKGCDKLKSLGAKGANQEEQVGSSQDEQVHSIHSLVNLVELRIESCDHLPTFPEDETLLLQALKTLHIQNCANPMVLTKGLEKLSLLQHLGVETCSNLKSLPQGIGQLSSLQHFAISDCPKLMSLSEEMQHLRSLQTLSIFACANLRALPGAIGKITSLQELKIERCSNLTALPDCLDDLSSLKELEILSCNSLISLPEGMQHLISLEKLKIVGCDNLKKLPEELGNCSALRVFAIIGCPNLEDLPEGLGSLQNLRLLEITDCFKLTDLPRGLGDLSSLGSLYIQRCPNLTSFPDTLRQMTSLRVLCLSKCPKLYHLSGWLGYLSALEKLIIGGCDNLIEFMPEGIQNLKSLQELSIFQCSKLETLVDGLENLPSLEKLVIWNCPKLNSSANVMEQLTTRMLRKLIIEGCPHLSPFLRKVPLPMW